MNPQIAKVMDISAQNFLALLFPSSRYARCMFGSMVKGSIGSIHDKSTAMLRMLIFRLMGMARACTAGNMDVDSVSESMDHSFLHR